MANFITLNQIVGVPERAVTTENAFLYSELLQIIRTLVANEHFNYECDFRDALAESLSEKYQNLMEVETISLTNDGHSKWRIDIVILFSGQYIPIELKYRHNDQSINGYGKDFADDVRRINELIDEFDDMQLGYAICLTDNNELIKESNNEITKYDQSEEAEKYGDNCIIWNDADRGYQIGIVGRFKTQYRLMLPNGNSFMNCWKNKKYK